MQNTAHRHAVVLDYRGTLDMLADPKAFVQALKDKGYFTVLFTGSSNSTIDAAFPGLLESFDSVYSKFTFFYDLTYDLAREGIKSGVLVDDEAFMKSPIEDKARVEKSWRWRFVQAERICTGGRGGGRSGGAVACVVDATNVMRS